MNKWIHRTITVTIIETWTFTWLDTAGAAAVSGETTITQSCTSVTRTFVHSSTVSSEHVLPEVKEELTDETIQSKVDSQTVV